MMLISQVIVKILIFKANTTFYVRGSTRFWQKPTLVVPGKIHKHYDSLVAL